MIEWDSCMAMRSTLHHRHMSCQKRKTNCNLRWNPAERHSSWSHNKVNRAKEFCSSNDLAIFLPLYSARTTSANTTLTTHWWSKVKSLTYVSTCLFLRLVHSRRGLQSLSLVKKEWSDFVLLTTRSPTGTICTIYCSIWLTQVWTSCRTTLWSVKI